VDAGVGLLACAIANVAQLEGPTPMPTPCCKALPRDGDFDGEGVVNPTVQPTQLLGAHSAQGLSPLSVPT
jgi:hypothetical protein